MPGVLGEGPVDPFNPDLLRDEPTDKVGWAVVQLPGGMNCPSWQETLLRETSDVSVHAHMQPCPSHAKALPGAACMCPLQVQHVLQEVRRIHGL